MNITFAQYHIPSDMDNASVIKCTVDGQTLYVPIDSSNADYAEIMRQVDEGTLTIQDAVE